MTISKIIKELGHVPKDKLEEVYKLIHAMTQNTASALSNEEQKEILSFAGSFSDMSKKDYDDFVAKTKEVRARLFDRSIEI